MNELYENKRMKITNPQYRNLNVKGTDVYFEMLDVLHKYTYKCCTNRDMLYENKFVDIANIVDKYLHRLAHNHNQSEPCENCNHSSLDQH